MSEKLKLPYLEKVDKRGNLEVWIVDGSYIRSHIDAEFTNFGQHYSFPFIPKNNILRRHPFWKVSFDDKLDCRWDSHPLLPRSQHISHLRHPDARPRSPKGPICSTMGVSA